MVNSGITLCFIFRVQNSLVFVESNNSLFGVSSRSPATSSGLLSPRRKYVWLYKRYAVSVNTWRDVDAQLSEYLEMDAIMNRKTP